MALSAIGINLGSQAGIPTDTQGTINYGISKIDISPYGASGTLFNGTVGISSIPQISIGTIPQVSVGTLPNIPNGTLGSVMGVGSISGIGTIPGIGSISGMGTLPGVGVVTNITNLLNGTIQNSGTVTGVGVVTSLTNGSINIPNGTLQALGTLGTLGTLNNIGSTTNLGQIYNAGTLQNGTLNQLNRIGTLQSGTLSLTDSSGSVVNVLTTVGTAAGQNAQLTAGAFMQLSGTSATNGGTLLGTVDVSNYRTVSVHSLQSFNGAFQYQYSNDLNHWEAVNLFDENYALTNENFGLESFHKGNIYGRYFRIMMTSYSAGTASVVVELYTNSLSYPINYAHVEAGNNPLIINGTINAGTITSIPNIPGGTLGSIMGIGSVSGLSNLPGGSIAVTAGTINSGTITAGTINTGTFTFTSGTFTTKPYPVTASGLTVVAGTATSVQLLGTNGTRTSAYFYNNSSGTLYLGYGGTAQISTGTFTVAVLPQGFFEMPTVPVYQGIISGIWSSSAGSVTITEV